MLVSVIVPNYNHDKYLKQRIDTILKQSYQNFEIIILDDCSTDNSRNIIEQYRNHAKISKIIYNETNSGSTFKQWNRGIGLAKGELIWIAESDDFAAPDLLQELTAEFAADPELGIAYCQSNWVNEKNEVTGNWQFWTHDLDAALFKSRFKITGKDYIAKFLIYRNTIPNASGVLFQKKYYDTVGGADETVLKCSDWFTWMKILSLSNIAYIPQHLNNFRYHDNSVIAMAKKSTVEEYIGKYDMFMRTSLDKFFKSSFSGNKDFKIIIKKNNELLLKEYIYEALFYFNNKSQIKGFGKIFKKSFSSVSNFLFVFKMLVNKSVTIIKSGNK
jgi:glycosyltransferase involved in cell wall biosynthesis